MELNNLLGQVSQVLKLGPHAVTPPVDRVANRQQHVRVHHYKHASGVCSDAHRGTTWGKIGDTPVVRDSGGRVSFIADRMNSKRFIEFLKKLRRDTGKPILVIVDNARYHHSKETQRFIADQDGDIQLAFLPAYAPEFNPDEQVWNHLKARLGKRTIMSKCDMKRHVLSILRSIQTQTELVKSFSSCLIPSTYWQH